MAKQPTEDNINAIVSSNIKKIRTYYGYSTEKMAEVTGVSRSMLNQIERGKSSPTLATLHKITSSLKIPITALTRKPRQSVVLVDIHSLEPEKKNKPNFRAYPVLPYNDDNHLECFYCEMDIASHHISSGHPLGTTEYILVFSGKLSVKVGDIYYDLKQGSFISFKGDTPHSYHNIGHTTVVFSEVISYVWSELINGPTSTYPAE